MITHTPKKNCNKCYIISGDNIEDLVNECMDRIRTKSQSFYKTELTNNLKERGNAIIDIHAGMGNFYEVILK